MGKRKNSNKVSKNEYSKFIISTIVLMNIVFTIAVLICFLRTGTEPTALIGAWFSFTTVELWSLSKIKRKKIDKEIKEYKYNNEEWG